MRGAQDSTLRLERLDVYALSLVELPESVEYRGQVVARVEGRRMVVAKEATTGVKYLPREWQGIP